MNNRKRQIIRAARTLFIEKGFTNTSILDIIAAANISKGTFYNHFNSKSECLIAILEETREETMNRRYEIGLNEDPSDIDVFIKQISVLMHVNRKQNLIKIFETVLSQSDADIKSVLNRQLLKEIQWIASRLTEIYGNEVETISYECANLVLGMIHHTMRTILIATNEYPSPEQVVKMAIRNVDAIIPHMTQTTDDLLITSKLFEELESTNRTVTKETLIKQLSGFVELLNHSDPESGIELSHHLLDELKQPKLKIFVLESILSSFTKAFTDTPHDAEAREIANSFWLFLKAESKNEK